MASFQLRRLPEVILSIPAKIILFLASYGLGSLSKIYNRHLYEECRIENDVRGWVARMVVLLTNFKEMKDMPGGISRATFHQRLAEILADCHELDRDEIANLAAAVFDKLEEKEGDDSPSSDNLLDLPEFVRAMSSQERLKVEDIVALADRDRKRSALERIFADTSIEPPARGTRPTLKSSAQAVIAANRVAKAAKKDAREGLLETSAFAPQVCPTYTAILSVNRTNERGSTNERSTENQRKNLSARFGRS